MALVEVNVEVHRIPRLEQGRIARPPAAASSVPTPLVTATTPAAAADAAPNLAVDELVIEEPEVARLAAATRLFLEVALPQKNPRRHIQKVQFGLVVEP